MQNDIDSSYYPYRRDHDYSTSPSFLHRLQDRNSLAWNDFMRLYTPLIRNWCRRMKKELSREERQDIAQDVARKALAAIARFDFDREKSNFRGWLRELTKNQTIDYLRARAKSREALVYVRDLDHSFFTKRPLGILEWWRKMDYDCDSEQDAEERIVLLREILKRIERRVQSKTWKVFTSLFYEEKSSSEVAEEMGMTAAAVRKVRSETLRRIREEYAKLGIESDLPETVNGSDAPKQADPCLDLAHVGSEA